LQESAAMLRLQADRIAELEKQLNFVENASVNSLVTSKQLSDEEIFKVAEKCYGHSFGLYGNHIDFARAIIKEMNK
jgi:hypothetical protein